jgi:hypothetical protein
VSLHDLTLAVTAAAAVAQAVRPQIASPREVQSMEGADSGLQGGESRPKAVDEIVLRLLHDPGFETSQLMFLKMNLVPHRPSPRQRWLPNEVSETQAILGSCGSCMMKKDENDHDHFVFWETEANNFQSPSFWCYNNSFVIASITLFAIGGVGNWGNI